MNGGFWQSLFASWTWRMAWRDSRSSRRRLLLFSTSIVLGVAALTAIGSFGKNLEAAIEQQAKSLLGADLVLGSRSDFTPEMEELFKSIGGEQSREINFTSMLYFPASDGARLVQVRALAGGFPYYGELETLPPQGVGDFRAGKGLLVEGNLLMQFSAQPGSEVRLGNLTTTVSGSLQAVPGETMAFATMAPRVYLPLSDLPKTGLMQRGSLVRYKVYFKLPPETDMPALMKRLEPDLDRLRLSDETVAERKKDLGESMNNLYRFLSLVGFIALLLGGVGIASAIQVHVKQKLPSVAVLRCLGASVAQTFAVYLAQGAALGFIGASTGAALGLGVQQVLPRVVGDFVPFEFEYQIFWSAVFRAMFLGWLICLLFALLPLLAVRRVSPLAVLRTGYDEAPLKRDPLLWFVYGLIVIGVVLFALSQTERWYQGLGFAGALGAAFGLLYAVARLIVWGARRFLPASLPYLWRQGITNLYRPNNRTVLLMLSLGLGVFLILTLWLTQNTLMQELFPEDGSSNRPNAILFDIQPDQQVAVADTIRAEKLPVLASAPVVTMRIQSVKGRNVETILAEHGERTPNWVLRREYRSTYRDALVESEKLAGGEWIPRVTADTSPVPISLETGIAKDLGVVIGDEIVFDVQGVPMTTRVASLREVDWRRVQANFFVVFPLGVLEEAPGFYIISTRVNDADESARLQRAVVKQFPNVSTIDLTLVLQTLDGILSKISFAIRFMAGFTVLTGLLVLVGAVLTGRYQRLRESILLRTLGASRKQILQILTVEYLMMGVFAGATGILLAIGANWALAVFMFKVAFALPPLLPLVITLGAVSALTIVTGLMTSWGISNHPPLEILRAEG